MNRASQESHVGTAPPLPNLGGPSVTKRVLGKWLHNFQVESWETLCLPSLGAFTLRALPLESRRFLWKAHATWRGPVQALRPTAEGELLIFVPPWVNYLGIKPSQTYRWLLSPQLTSVCNHMWIPKREPLSWAQSTHRAMRDKGTIVLSHEVLRSLLPCNRYLKLGSVVYTASLAGSAFLSV